jgi:hypothetical protein
MFETFKIKYLGHQPTAIITSKTLDKIIRRDYGNNFKKVREKLESIKSDSSKAKNRFSAAVLKLSNGDLTKIDSYIEMCNYDFRDIVSQAEYPRRFKLDFDKIAQTKIKETYLQDWIEYSNWLTKK